MRGEQRLYLLAYACVIVASLVKKCRSLVGSTFDG
jgi:hypothetical protein